jgi:hypothetical protein
MARNRQRVVRTNHAYKVDGFIELIVIVYKIVSWLCRLLFTWRTEVGMVGTLIAAYSLAGHQDVLPAWLILAVPAAGLTAWPRSRRVVLGRLACARARRRVLACCRNTGVMNKDGRLPWVAKSRSTPVGERVTLWLFAGQSSELLEERAPELRAACRARDAQVIRNRADSSRVVIEIVRRDPFAEHAALTSPLLARVSRLAARPAPLVED